MATVSAAMDSEVSALQKTETDRAEELRIATAEASAMEGKRNEWAGKSAEAATRLANAQAAQASAETRLESAKSAHNAAMTEQANSRADLAAATTAKTDALAE